MYSYGRGDISIQSKNNLKLNPISIIGRTIMTTIVLLTVFFITNKITNKEDIGHLLYDKVPTIFIESLIFILLVRVLLYVLKILLDGFYLNKVKNKYGSYGVKSAVNSARVINLFQVIVQFIVFYALLMVLRKYELTILNPINIYGTVLFYVASTLDSENLIKIY